MIVETSEPLKDTDFTPLMWRTLQLAAIEASSPRYDNGNRIGPEHLLVAFIQEGTGAGAELLNNCRLTVADVRNGLIIPKHTLPTATTPTA